MVDGKLKVHQRVKQMRQVFETWAVEGYPSDVILPESLNEARQWEAVEHGIAKIGSKRDFTTRHPVWGEDVEAILSLLRSLKPREKKRVYKSEASRRIAAQANASESEALLKRVTGQWHEAREELRYANSRIEQLLMDVQILNEQKGELEADNAKLRKALAERDGPLRVI